MWTKRWDMISRYQAGILAVIVIYTIAMLGQSLLGWLSQTQAEQPLATHRLVAVLVQESLVDELQDELERYTGTYMPAQMDNVMPLVISIYPDYTPYQIHNTLENLYYEGLIDQPSTLEGIVAIGDIPLPTVWDQETSYQTIFPYVDFDNTAYRWSPLTERFEGTDQINSPQAELRHGLLPLGDDPQTYRDYFTKLQIYAADPSSFVDQRIWIDDFTNLSSVIDPEKMGYYLNASIFAEDLNYHRYSSLLLSLLQGVHNDRITSALSGLASIPSLPLVGDGSDDFLSGLNDYTENLSQTIGNSDQQANLDATMIPTLMLQQSIQELLLSYPELLSQGYRAELEEIREAGGRWTGDQVDSHAQMIYLMDSMTMGTPEVPGVLTRVNTLLESAIIDTVAENNYQVPYPLFVQAQRGVGDVCDSVIREAMYHGRNGRNIDDVSDLSIYQGTYANYTGLDKGYVVQDSQRSIGASYSLFDTQVEAHRAYNIDNQEDAEIINHMNDINGRWCENIGFERFIEDYRGGNTLLNLKVGEDGKQRLDDYDPRRAWDPYDMHQDTATPSNPWYLSMAGPVFDQAGTKATTENNPHASSYLIADQISIQQVSRHRKENFLDEGEIENVPFCYDTRFSWDSLGRPHEFFDARSAGVSMRVNQRSRGGYSNCSDSSWLYVYKLIDSTQVNASPTPEQIAAMNMTTPDRPIDSDHTITFQGLSATPVTLIMPNIWDVPVFDTIGTGEETAAELLSIEQIEQNIRTYLVDIVASYNNILSKQNQLASTTYDRYQSAYDFLATANPQASVNRSYQLLSEDFLIQILGETYIDQVAAALRRQNIPRSSTTRSKNLSADFEYTHENAQIDLKISEIMDSYLSEDVGRSLMPGYQDGGYESIILHTDTNSTSVTQTSDSREIVDRIRKQRRNQMGGFEDTGSEADAQLLEDAEFCGYTAGTPVPLVGDRLDALACRREVTAAKPFDVTVTLPSIDERAVQQRDNFATSRSTYTELFQIQQQSTEAISEMMGNEEDTNEDALNNLPASRRPMLRRAYYQVSLDWNQTAVTIDDLDDIVLEIQSSSAIDDDVILSLTTTGAQCVMIDGNDTCAAPMDIPPSSIYETQIMMPVFENYQAGMVAATLSLCDAANPDICLTKTSSLTLMPGQIADASLSLPSGTIAAGALTPVRIHATDRGGNTVGTQPLPLSATSIRSRFENGPQHLASVETLTPHQAVRWYHAPTSSLGESITSPTRTAETQPQLTFDTLTLSQGTDDNMITRDERSLISTPATIQASIIYQGQSQENPTIGLNPLMDEADFMTLPRMVVTVRDQQGSPLTDQLVHISTNAVFAHLINEEGESATTWLTDEQGQIHLGVVPHGGVGESTITTRFYGSDQLTQNIITRGPGPASTVNLITTDERLRPGETTSVDITLTDDRGHHITDETSIRLAIRGPIAISGAQSTLTLPANEFPVTIRADHQGRATIVAMIEDLDIQEQTADVHEWTIAEDLIDLENINSLTMFLDGRGRGNRLSPEGQERLQSAFATSETLLALSTTLMPPEQIGSGEYLEPRSIDAMPGESVAQAFMDDSTPITDRGQDASRGEAHRPYSSPLMVVYGDPLLHHTGNQVPTSTHNAQRGQRIYTQTDKVIAQTIPFDLNADELEDLLVTYTDGTIHLLKNYGGQNDPFVDMGMIIAVDSALREIMVGDIDGDGFDDIIIWTQDNQLRAYQNNQGVIDVDGYPLCLRIPKGPNSLEGIHQLFVYDMDRDGALDIITNDAEGLIAITYGDQDASYVSRDRLVCDPEREDRTTDRTIVTQIGVELTAEAVHDSSLIHRDGLTYTASEVGSDAYQAPDTNGLIDGGSIDPTALNDLLSQQMTTDTDELIAASVGDAYRYIASPMRFIPPHYGDEMAYEDMYYVPAYSQRSIDPITIEKFYDDHNGGLLLPGDTVTVTVRARAHQDTILTYLDYGRGSREVEKTTDHDHAVVGQVIESFDRSELDGDVVYRDSPTSDYLYMLDNLSFEDGQTRERSYDLIYAGGPLVEIDVRTFDDDEYLDIIIAPIDSCRQIRQERVNEAIGDKRSYKGSITDLGVSQDNLTQNGNQEMQEGSDDVMEDVQQAIEQQDISLLDILGEVGEAWGQDFFSNYTQGGSFWENLDDSLGGGGPDFTSSLNMDVAIDPEILSAYEDISQGLCHGFGVGEGCGGLPVPFNMAFLAPGDYQVMGCKVAEDKGLPAFFFPGNLGPTPTGLYIPAPYFPVGTADKFYRPKSPGGTWSSFLRIYVAPTLTQQVGVAICGGLYSVGMNVPAPFNHLGGNCIVTAISMDSTCDNNIDEDIRPDGADSLSQDRYDIAQRGTCSNPAAQVAANGTDAPTTPFIEATWSSIVDTRQSPGHDNNGYPPASSLQGGSMLGGMLYLDQQPISISLETEDIVDSGVTLTPGIDTNNQIKGGNGGGLAQCIVQGRLDPQITYIANNLTTLSLTVYLPDVSGLTQGMDTMTAQTIANIRKQDLTIDNEHTTTTSEAMSTTHNEKLIDSLSIQRAQIDQFSPLDNPFSKLEKIFEEVPLISISKRSVPINVPLITDEDITAYESSLKEWVTHNKKTAKERGDIATATFGVCGQAAGISLADGTSLQDQITQKDEMIAALTQVKNSDNASAEEKQLASSCLDILVSGKLEGIITFQQDMSEMMQMVQSNMEALRTYKEFPSQLATLLGSVDRYVADAAVFVTSIFGTINERLSTNARIFNSYVDAIISMKIAVQTRQALIDLSVDWKQSCSTCSNDNYGSYSCNLSFMCPSNLPILEFPPLKIPDIYVDLSHIDAGVDLVLPEISFVSQSVDLPTIPNFPQPPVISVDFTVGDWGDMAIEESLSLVHAVPDIPSLPQIPTLPSAPDLPQLPPIIPEVDLSLPYLPPPPEIPELSPSIQQMISVGENIGKLFCIMKGEIGLVSEGGVKAKIEQLTQRTWNVPLFDYFNLTHLHDAPTLQGMDLRVDSSVDFTMNINALYSILNSVAGVANEFTDKMRTGSSLWLQEQSNNLQNNIDQNLTIPDTNFQGALPETDRDDLMTSLNLIQNEYQTPSREIQTLKKLIDDHRSSDDAYFDIAEIEHQKSTILASLHEYGSHLASLQQEIYPQSMNSVLALLDTNTALPVQEQRFVATLTVPDVMEEVRSLNPAHDYIAQNKEILESYEYDLSMQAAADKALTNQAYTQMRTHITQTKALASGLLTSDNDRPSFAPNQGRWAQVDGDISTPDTIQYDFSQYLQGTYFLSGGVAYDVIRSEYREDQITHSLQSDLNHDGQDDMILRDEHSIYLKYAQGNKLFQPHISHGDEGDTRYIDMGSDGAQVDEYGAYESLHGDRFRVWSVLPSVQNIQADGQTYETIRFSWDDSDVFGREYDGYLVRLSKRVDIHHDSAHRDMTNPPLRELYVLVIGTEWNIPRYIRLDHDAPYQSTQDLIDEGRLIIQETQIPTQRVTLAIDEISRHRHYAQVAHMRATDIEPRNNRQRVVSRLSIASPWSKQAVAGPQIIADDDAPLPTVRLTRDRVDDEVIGSGLDLRGYVGTYYTLDIQRDDPSGTVSNRIRRPDGMSREYEGDHAERSGLFFTGNQQYQITIGADDSQDNTGERMVILTIDSPDIQIIDVESDGEMGTITSQISHDIDEGVVQFENQSGNMDRSVLSGTIGESIPLTTAQTIITGGLYTIGDMIGLYDDSETQIGSLDPHTGELSLFTEYLAEYEIIGEWRDHFLRRVVRARDDQRSLFAITLPIRSIISQESLHPSYTREDVSIGPFDQCLMYQQECVIARDESGHLVIPAPYNYQYYTTYHYQNNTIQTTIVRQADEIPVAHVEMETQDLLPPDA